MAIVLQTQILLDPNNQIAHLVDYTGLTEAIEYVISATFLAADTRFVFQGHFDIALNHPPVGVPQAQTEVPATISTVPTPAAATPPARYPYAINDRLIASNLNLAFDFDPGAAPPIGNGGGAGRFKYWVDTSGALPTLRQCIAIPRATPGVYVAGEWLTLGTIDAAAGKFHFDTDHVDFGGGGTINVGSVYANGPIHTAGPYGGYYFYDHTTAASWVWYATDGSARLYLAGDKVLIDSGGSVFAASNITAGAALSGITYYINTKLFATSDGATTSFYDPSGVGAIHLQATVNYYDADTHLFRNNAGNANLVVFDNVGNLTINGPYLHFAASGGYVNTTGGPMIFADNNNTVMKIGPGNGAFTIQNYAGTQVASIGAFGNFSLTGNIYITGAISVGDMYRLRDRDFVSPEWGWYVQSGVARLWYSSFGDRMTIDANGAVNVTGELGTAGNLHAGQSLFLGGPYVLMSGANSGQGPYIQAGAVDYIFRMGPSGNRFWFEGAAGNIISSIDSAGTGFFVNLNATGITCSNMLAYGNIQANGGTHSVAGYSMKDPAGGTNFSIWSDPGYGYIRFAPGWTWQFNLSGDASNGALVWFASGNDFMHLRWGNDYLILNNYGTWAGWGAFVNLSDRRAKKNITPSTRGLAEILKLNPVEFDRISDAVIPRELGFTAEDVRDILPEAVRVVGMKLPDGTGGLDDAEPTLGLMDSAIVAALVNAVKELNTRLIALE